MAYSDDYSDDYEKGTTTMRCFENIIGVKRTCDNTPSISQLYINDLTGLTVKDADASISDEYASGVRMIKDKISFATNLIIQHVKNSATKFLARSVIENGTIGIFKEKNTIPSEAGKLKGVQYKLKSYPYFSFNLASISFFGNETKSISVYVYDLVTGEKLDTIAVMATAGKAVNVVVNKKYNSGSKPLNLFICTDSDISHNQADLYKGHCSGCTNTYNGNYSYLSYREIAIDSDVIESNLIGGQSTGGISISYSLECNIEPFLCTIAPSLGMPILYKSGVLLMDEIIYSKRQNSAITVYKENNQELRDMYELEFERTMSAILNNMIIPKDICFHCNSSIKTVAYAP